MEANLVVEAIADVLHQLDYNLKTNSIEDDAVRDRMLESVDQLEKILENVETEKNALNKLDEVTKKKMKNAEAGSRYEELEDLTGADFDKCLQDEQKKSQKNKNKPMKAEFEKARAAIKKKPAEGADDDDDIIEDEQVVKMKDPITKTRITDPVRNKICLHVYQHDSIISYINDNKSKRLICQCPTPGCTNKKGLSPQDIEKYPDFFKTCGLMR